MIFTLDGYEHLLGLLNGNGYRIVDYFGWEKYDKCVILRHDVDMDLQRAFTLAQIEYKYKIKSTYFVLLTSNFYNIQSYRNRSILNQMQDMGHTIGLHFDEKVYPKAMGNVERVQQEIKKELNILSEILETEASVISYHRPTKEILNADIEIQGVVNSYANLFFRQFKYLSDSRMHWREPVLDIIREGKHTKLHILTHPFWYCDEKKSMREILYEFINIAGIERFNNLDENLTNLRDVIEEDEREDCNSSTTLFSVAGIFGKDGKCE